jgi:hypothetical protein
MDTVCTLYNSRIETNASEVIWNDVLRAILIVWGICWLVLIIILNLPRTLGPVTVERCGHNMIKKIIAGCALSFITSFVTLTLYYGFKIQSNIPSDAFWWISIANDQYLITTIVLGGISLLCIVVCFTLPYLKSSSEINPSVITLIYATLPFIAVISFAICIAMIATPKCDGKIINMPFNYVAGEIIILCDLYIIAWIVLYYYARVLN